MRFSATGSATPSGLNPSQVQAAYGFNNVKFGAVTGDGSGETIAIVDAFNDPTILSDLAKFDQQFGLAAPPSIKVVNQNGGTTLPASDRGWSGEIALDVEWAHAMAPGANILLVEANSAFDSDLDAALDYARNASGVVVVSSSWGGGEYSTESSEDVHFTTPSGHAGVTFTVAAGDNGTGAEYPSSSPNVLSVGGTTLRLVNGAWSSESVWSGGGGGQSLYEKLPSYQSGLGLSRRGTPDVAYDANPSTGFAVLDTYGDSGWVVFGGTSAGAPQWAAIIAIADQGRALAGQGSLSNAQAALYSIPRADFHDITSGSNGIPAAVGYDAASGLGSPIANLVIADLAGYGSSGTGGGTGGSGTTTLTAPSITSASANSPTSAQLSWTAVSGATGYRIILTENGSTSVIGTVASGTSSVTVTGLTSGATETFVVEAYNTASTADSTSVSITMPVQVALAAPTITSAAALSSTSAQLAWTAVSGATGYSVLVVQLDGSTTSLGSVSATNTSATVTGLAAGSTVTFEIEAFNSSAVADSAAVSVALPAPSTLASPQLTAVALSSTRALLSWNLVTGAQGYRIYWWNGYRAVFLGTVGAGTKSVQISGLTPSTTNQFLVEAYGGGSVADSAWVSVIMPSLIGGRAAVRSIVS
jgi:subtilase family serine protease